MVASEPNAPPLLTGGCMCHAVQYEVPDAFHYAMNCHCSNCRRTTGAAFKPFAGIPIAQLRIIRGAGDVLVYGGNPNYDVHCGKCGSLLYSVVRDGTYAHVAMGTLMDEPSVRPSKHIFVGSKAKWYEIPDDLPQFEAFPTA